MRRGDLCAIGDEGLVNLREVGVEGLKEQSGVGEVSSAGHLADRVHGKLGDSNIDTAESKFGSEDGADSRATEGVIANDEGLGGDAGNLGEGAGEEFGFDSGGVTSVCILLDDGTRMDERGVVGFVLGAVVGVQAMSHIARK